MLIYLQLLESQDDRDAFEQIYMRYRGSMHSTALRILHDSSLAEDAVHQAFLSMLNHFETMPAPESKKTQALCLIMAEHKAIDLLRKNKHFISLDFDETTHGLVIPPPGDHGLADAITQLKAQHRIVLLLRYAYGYSPGEIGELLGIKQSAVEKAIWRAKCALKQALEEGEADE